MIRVAILTVSDRSSRGEREDRAGPALAASVSEWPAEVAERELVADEREQIEAAIRRLAAGADLVLTTGGTGVGPRDVTPEATRAVVDREVPGLGEEMRRRSLSVTPYAALSRATAGTIGSALVVNLPGSPKGATECLSFVSAAVRHALVLLSSREFDCADPG